MLEKLKYRKVVIGSVIGALCIVILVVLERSNDNSSERTTVAESTAMATEAASNKPEKSFIKWVEFNASYDALCIASQLDISSHEEEVRLNWIELLAYAATVGGGSFNSKSIKYINELANRLKNGELIDEITKDMKYYSYYYDSYSAVLGGMLGEYEIENDCGKYDKKYGIRAFSPIGKGFYYSDYDDFGVSRSFGYRRQHLGHDMMGLIGTPIIAVESGYIEVMGWNKYGGWRIGIRSHDRKRYYYYAHLRQNYPFADGLKEGDIVTAGDVIGYMGHTGYSNTENVNNIDQVHLHFGLQLIFDESQKECNNEIWIDCYALCKFLEKNRSEIEKVGDTREWKRVKKMKVEVD